MGDKGKLILICEGGAHTVEYFRKNKVYPSAVVFDALKFKEMIPYLSDKDEILFVIKGMTDFTMVEIYSLIDDIKGNIHKVKSIVVMSNILLGKIDFEYYLYEGDLFYGSEKKIYMDKEVNSNRGRKSIVGRKSGDDVEKSAVIDRFKIYNKSNTRFQIYGRVAKEGKVGVDDLLIGKIVVGSIFD